MCQRHRRMFTVCRRSTIPRVGAFPGSSLGPGLGGEAPVSSPPYRWGDRHREVNSRHTEASLTPDFSHGPSWAPTLLSPGHFASQSFLPPPSDQCPTPWAREGPLHCCVLWPVAPPPPGTQAPCKAAGRIVCECVCAGAHAGTGALPEAPGSGEAGRSTVTRVLGVGLGKPSHTLTFPPHRLLAQPRV